MTKIHPALALVLLLCPRPAPAEAEAAGGDELIVRPGGELRLTAPEAGARVESAIDGGALLPAGTTLAAPERGDHWLAVASRDLAGNRSAVRWIRLRVDGEPPRLTLSSEPEPFVDSDGKRWLPAASWAVAETDDDVAGVARLQLAVGDNVEETETESLRRPLPGDGEARLTATAVDRVGNSSETTLYLFVDATGPVGELVTVGPQVDGDPRVLAPSARVEARLADTGSGLAAWTPLTDGEEVPADAWDGPWSAGRHRLEAVAVDRVGNQSRLGPLDVVVDDAGPEIGWRLRGQGAVGDDGERYYSPPVTLEANADDAPAGVASFEASADGERFTPFAGNAAREDEQLHLRAVDRVGNVTTTVASWRLDRTPPEISLPGEKGGLLEIRLGETVRPVVRDGDSGVGEATFDLKLAKLFGAPQVRWRPLPEAIEIPAPGLWLLAVEAVDRLGHRAFARWKIRVLPASRGD